MSEKVLYSHIDDPVNQVCNYCTLDKNNCLNRVLKFFRLCSQYLWKINKSPTEVVFNINVIKIWYFSYYFYVIHQMILFFFIFHLCITYFDWVSLELVQGAQDWDSWGTYDCHWISFLSWYICKTWDCHGIFFIRWQKNF